MIGVSPPGFPGVREYIPLHVANVSPLGADSSFSIYPSNLILFMDLMKTEKSLLLSDQVTNEIMRI